MARPVIGSAYQPRRRLERSAAAYSELRPAIDGDAAALQRALLDEAAKRAARSRSVRDPVMRAAAIKRALFDLRRALKPAAATPTTPPEKD